MRVIARYNRISLDTDGTIRAMLPYLELAMNEAEARLIELMREAVGQTVTAPGEWIEMIRADIRRISAEYMDSVISREVGLGYKEGDWHWLRAMVVTYGMGIYGLNGNQIMAGPEGRIVWNNDLNQQIPSRVKTEHEIPMSWYHTGGWFIQNAIANIRHEFEDIVQSQLSNMPSFVFSNNITSVQR